MKDPFNLKRFLEAQSDGYVIALNEIKSGQKCSPWMWYIFPQFACLGRSSTTVYYAIKSTEEARAYLDHHILGSRLMEITKVFLELENKSAREILGSPDDLKMKSSMTLFNLIQGERSLFDAVLNKYYGNRRCQKTKLVFTGN
ncbi:DUF1810 domain-containing protein [Robertkochia sediminum]|uniref:DUF1810 domain-containing protein n=1 Tax=Robertkochia sediminum TaxID=2785326 RepID=UPI0019311961|nr:DUF1810 domain-containing protein [Robertkochia sediminum]MBL7472942.1 DUF1810 domain-containing protein [Robertkochia sediminum]